MSGIFIILLFAYTGIYDEYDLLFAMYHACTENVNLLQSIHKVFKDFKSGIYANISYNK